MTKDTYETKSDRMARYSRERPTEHCDCGTVAFSCHRHGRRFIGGDIGHRERDGRRWVDIVNESLAQGRLFA